MENQFQQVKLITNPVKTLICQHEFSQTEVAVDCRIHREVMDLSTGVWQFAVQSIVVKNTGQAMAACVFDIKTNLTNTYKMINGKSVAVHECIESIDVRCEPREYEYHSPSVKTFFTVYNRPGESFRTFFMPNEVAKDVNEIYQLSCEIKYIFQRML